MPINVTGSHSFNLRKQSGRDLDILRNASAAVMLCPAVCPGTFRSTQLRRVSADTAGTAEGGSVAGRPAQPPVMVASRSVLRASPTLSPGPQGRPAPCRPWTSPSPRRALFAFGDPPPTLPSSPLALRRPGLWKGLLSLGTSNRLCPQVMLTAVGPPILGIAESCPILVFLAKRIGAKVAKCSRRFAAHVTVMPRTFPLPEGPLAQAQAGQVVGLGAGPAVAQHQLAPVPTAEALVLGPLPFASCSATPTFLLGLFALFL